MNSCKTADITARVGGWRWSEGNQSPSWESLSKAQLWHSKRAEVFNSNFCTPKHTVRQVPSSEENERALTLIRGDSGHKASILMFNGLSDEVPFSVTALPVRCIVYHVIQKFGQVKLPSHVQGLLEDGLPCLLWGTKASIDRITTTIRKLFPTNSAIPIHLFEKPLTNPITSKYRDFEFSALLFGPDNTLQTQVFTPSLLCTISIIHRRATAK